MSESESPVESVEGHSTSTTAHTEQPPMGLFSINPGLMIWTWVSFILFFFLLKKYAFGPLFKSVKDREKLIESSVTDAGKIKDELAAIELTRKKVIDETQSQADELMRKYRENGQLLAVDIGKKANSDAARLLSQTKEQIEIEKTSAMKSFRTECADLVLTLSEKMVEESFTEEKHRQYIKKCLEQL